MDGDVILYDVQTVSNSSFPCHLCDQSFTTERGLKIHRTKKHNQNSQSIANDGEFETAQHSQDEDGAQIELEDIFKKAFGAPLVNSSGGDENNVWHKRWHKIAKFKGKQYTLPQGAIGRRFVDMITKEILDIVNGIFMSERVFIFCSTILQKDKIVTNGSDIRCLLKKRMDMWDQGLFDELISEAFRCDKQMKISSPKCDEDHKIRVFTRLVLQGKLRDATRWITDRSGGGVLEPDSVMEDGRTVFQVLDNKHPEQKLPQLDLFEHCDTLPVMVDVDVSAGHIEKVARSMRGGAGPSGTDADQWKSMLLRYGAHSLHLRDAVASLVRWLSNGIIEWNAIRALLARRGLALDKSPGVRPIGVGEILQRLCAKTMALLTGEDVREKCGADQLCAGTKAGIEGAIHAMSELFEENDNSAVLLVDANNAFNTISRPLSLWNARVYWPRCARFLFNTYRGFAKIVFRNSDRVILSREGTTQGDPLAMLMYAIGLLPLIRNLKSNGFIQNWYADDSACFGTLPAIKEWFDLLMNEGPKWGYYPEPSKCVLVIKSHMENEAKSLFSTLNVNIVKSHRFLGGVIGPQASKITYVKEKIGIWIECVKKLSVAAKKSPQAAHTSFARSLQSEWLFTQRVVGKCSEEYSYLMATIRQYYTPAILGQEISDIEHDLFELPNRHGGLNIKNPTKSAANAFEVSRRCVDILVAAIKSGSAMVLNEHELKMKEVIMEERLKKETYDKNESSRLINMLPDIQKRPLQRIIEGNASQWLGVIPTSADHFDLSPSQFRDALSLRYGRRLQGLPSSCDGCGNEMDLTHALNCKKGGLVKHGHDQHRDHCAAMANLAWSGVGIEPEMRESSNEFPALYGDFKANSVWEVGRVAFFDNRIVNADAPTYASQSWTITARRHAMEKHSKYDKAAEDLRGSFTPLICSADGVFHKEYDIYVKRLALTLAEKWNRPYSNTLSWIRVQEQISIIRAVSLRVRGTRKKIRCLPYEDGAGMPLFHC